MSVSDTEDNLGRPAWDSALADQIVGRTVLVGITRAAHAETPASQEQLHGVVVSADHRAGFRVELRGVRAGEDYWLPPLAINFVAAAPGIYRLASTGEEVENPDYLSTWVIEAPAG